MLELIPGILEKTPEEIEKKLQIIKPFSRHVHIDVIDGKFDENTSYLETAIFEKYKNDFFFEVHLMVDNPLILLQKYADAGFKRFLGHIEKMPSVDEFVALGQVLGEVGLALDLNTAVEEIKIPFDDLDSILLMSVKAGKSGQEFDKSVIDKIKTIRDKTQISLEIDGGINEDNLKLLKAAGANRFVATSHIFNSQDPLKSYEKLTSVL